MRRITTLLKDFFEMLLWVTICLLTIAVGISIFAIFIDALGSIAAYYGGYPGDIAMFIYKIFPGNYIFAIYVFPILAWPILHWAGKKSRR